ncbi:hypothetical protein B0T25DRAFT_192337 [Lasiosphaeria hispida]|uniref:NACHT domain-containing protein n=1 Tax=Lasiosphaeria hispida TaxID=260671 RepID=A0AAJ0MDS6_9PEZI|nr:hypothetical protein B0T25DRAFT_192337 [Lasiosphaeria hispida]
MTQPAPDNVFVKARDGFLASLSEPERSAFKDCSSPEELIAEVNRLIVKGPQNSQFGSLLNRLSDFSDNLGCYFKAVDIFVQSNPETAAVVWGAIRLVLQLASNFGSFFNKLVEVLKQLGQKIPKYQEILQCSPKDVSVTFQQSLTGFYVDLLEFLTAVARVFRRKNGELKRAMFVAIDVTFRPFDAQYGGFLDKIKNHCRVLEEEQTFLQTKVLVQTREDQMKEIEKQEQRQRAYERFQQDMDIRLENAHNQEELYRIKKNAKEWLNPPRQQHINAALDATRNVRVNGTGDWILNDRYFTSWVSKEHVVASGKFQNTLWVRGNPGAGKTVLASWVLQSLQGSQGDGCNSTLTVPYFFSYMYAETRDPRTAWSLTLSYILSQCYGNPDVLDAFSFAVRSSASTYALISELVELFRMIAYRLPRIILLFDGLDEIIDPEDFASTVDSILHERKTKAILFSRPNIAILQRNTSGLLRVIDLTAQNVDADIQLFLKAKLDRFEEGELPDSYTIPWIVSHLAKGANGMILWARLMMDFLAQLDDTDSRAETIMSVTQHEDLVSMYLRMLQLIARKSSVERNTAKRVFLYLSYSNRHLSARELWDIVLCWEKPSASPGTRTDDSPTTGELDRFHSSVLVRCASLVERRANGYAFIHQSVLEFFWAGLEQQGNLRFPLDPAVMQFLDPPAIRHNQIVIDCLTYLTRRLPGKPLSGDARVTIEPQAITRCLPFADYAAIQWPIHLKLGAQDLASTDVSVALAQSCQNLCECLSMFTSNKLAVMTWVELEYTFSDNIDHLDSIRDWCARVESLTRSLPSGLRDIPVTLQSFYMNIKQLDSEWGPGRLRDKANMVWGDVTVFFDSPFLQKTTAVEIYSMKPASPRNQELATDPLVVVSRKSSQDNGLNAVLSIWPSKGFEDAWIKSKDPTFTDNDLIGWVARFEKHDTQQDPPEKVLSADITLEAGDIHKHLDVYLVRLRQMSTKYSSFKFSYTSSLAFPTAIAGRLDMFLVLEKTYMIDDTTIGDPHIRSTQLPEVDARALGVQRTSSSTLSLGLAMTYSYQISDDGRYVLRKHLKCLPTLGIQEPITFALSAFGSIRNRNSFDLLAQYGSQQSIEQISHCSFHPVFPLILFYSGGLGVMTTIRLWGFGSSSSWQGGGDQGAESSSGQPKTSVVVSTLLPGRFKTRLTALYFSACGKSAVAQESKDSRPEVHSVDTYPAYLQAIQDAAKDNMSLWENTTSQSISNWKGAHLQLSAHSMEVRRPWSDGQTISRLTFTGGSRNSLRAVRTDGEMEVTQDILSFPNSWETIDGSIDASVEQSKPRQDHLDITVNQPSKNWYMAGQKTTHTQPLFARKHVGAVLVPEATEVKSGIKRPLEEISGPLFGDIFSLEEPSKQPRLLGPGESTEEGLMEGTTSSIWDDSIWDDSFWKDGTSIWEDPFWDDPFWGDGVGGDNAGL